MKSVLCNKDVEHRLFEGIEHDLQRQSRWSSIVPFMEKNNHLLCDRIKQSPAIYIKYKHWLLNSERLMVAQVLMCQALHQQCHLSQGQLVRLLVNNSNDGLMDEESSISVDQTHLNRYWTNQMRNNIHPIMADYFNLMTIKWEGTDKPGCGEYVIYASDLLINFFTEELYKA